MPPTVMPCTPKVPLGLEHSSAHRFIIIRLKKRIIILGGGAQVGQVAVGAVSEVTLLVPKTKSPCELPEKLVTCQPIVQAGSISLSYPHWKPYFLHFHLLQQL